LLIGDVVCRVRLPDGSGMSREVHVPFCEELAGKFRWLTLHQRLLDYTEQPTPPVAVQLNDEFECLFSTTTGYDLLDERIALTKDKKEALLLPLCFPFLPLHNNDSEGGAQHQARLRDIHLQTRNEKGTRAKDTFATIVKTQLVASFIIIIFSKIIMLYFLKI